MDWTRWFSTGSGFGLDRVGETWPLLVAALVGSLVTSILIAVLYVRFYLGRGTGSQVHRSFPLMGPAVTAIFIAVQFSLPLSLGLLGALSIVRFRTPIKEAEEIGFILLVIAVSLSWATLNLPLLAIVLVVAVLGALSTARLPILRGRTGDGMIVVTLPTREYQAKSEQLLGVLQRALPRGRIDSISENPDESVISYSFLRLETAAFEALRCELAEVTTEASSNVFFNRSREL